MKLNDGFIRATLVRALAHNIRMRVLSSDPQKMPAFLVESIEEATAPVTRSPEPAEIATGMAHGGTSLDDINEDLFSQHLFAAD
ncbi:hypothetical protein F443_16293 [Phytophthora nicotianae P1569]|uniref:Uncharacterized protein n=1 Tax=Phytophthora nicotianae P1569 TaxID=1317065 RepID=V9EH14_PHYNI|nr:hypothetical protein F443_16293 [Phytophthora nicotianae P1569]